jgi:hypothetical protein
MEKVRGVGAVEEQMNEAAIKVHPLSHHAQPRSTLIPRQSRYGGEQDPDKGDDALGAAFTSLFGIPKYTVNIHVNTCTMYIPYIPKRYPYTVYSSSHFVWSPHVVWTAARFGALLRGAAASTGAARPHTGCACMCAPRAYTFGYERATTSRANPISRRSC